MHFPFGCGWMMDTVEGLFLKPFYDSPVMLYTTPPFYLGIGKHLRIQHHSLIEEQP